MVNAKDMGESIMQLHGKHIVILATNSTRDCVSLYLYCVVHTLVLTLAKVQFHFESSQFFKNTF
jgi:hypothetical protein